MKFYSSVRIDLRRVEAIKHGTEVIGTRVRAKVVKNKVAPPFRQAEFDIMFDRGISKAGDLLDLGVSMGPVHKSGAFYSIGETRLGQGREAARDFLHDHTDIMEDLERQIRSLSDTAKAGPPPSPEVQEEEEAVAVTAAASP